MKRTGTILIIIGVIAAAVMTYAGAYRSILFFFYERAVAQVLDGPRWMGPEAGFRILYEFRDEKGVTYRGQVILAEKFAEFLRGHEESRELPIRYFPLAPGLSYMDESKVLYRFTPYGLLGYLIALWLIVRGLSLMCKKAEDAPPSKGSPETSPGNSKI